MFPGQAAGGSSLSSIPASCRFAVQRTAGV